MTSNDTSKSTIFYPGKGSAVYNYLIADKEQKKKTLKKWMRLNKYLTIPFYRVGFLPLLGAGFIFLLLFTKGRKTGKVRITPLEYQKINGTIHIFASRGDKANWLMNLKANPEDVKIRVGFKKYKVKTEIIEMEKRKDIFHWYVSKHPMAAKALMGWDKKEDDPEKTDFSFLAEKIVVVKLYTQQ